MNIIIRWILIHLFRQVAHRFSQEPTLAYYYNQNHPLMRSLKRELHYVQDVFYANDAPFHVKLVDCSTYLTSCMAVNVKSVPYYELITADKIYEYNGRKDAESILDFVQKYTGFEFANNNSRIVAGNYSIREKHILSGECVISAELPQPLGYILRSLHSEFSNIPRLYVVHGFYDDVHTGEIKLNIRNRVFRTNLTDMNLAAYITPFCMQFQESDIKYVEEFTRSTPLDPLPGIDESYRDLSQSVMYEYMSASVKEILAYFQQQKQKLFNSQNLTKTELKAISTKLYTLEALINFKQYKSMAHKE